MYDFCLSLQLLAGVIIHFLDQTLVRLFVSFEILIHAKSDSLVATVLAQYFL